MAEATQDQRTIFAMGGGGFSMEPDNLALDQYILALTKQERPKVCFLPTASGDAEEYIQRFHTSLETLGTEHSHLSLTRYNQPDPHRHLLDQDVIYVGGGNSFQMLLVWRAHGIHETLRQAWEEGIILCGISAGSLCWFSGSITDSWGHPLQVLDDGLGFLPDSHCPHYDGEPERQEIYEESIASGVLPPGVAVEDSCGVLYRGTQFVESVCSVPGKSSYRVTADGQKAQKTPIPTRTLPRLTPEAARPATK
ncbi:MAG TPA: peptidase E [Deltaproteobacteria bacterium]|nr:peptidase E [Deltaproteobacteria bacterium]HCP44791.1 peptidase E [Deltaproteobacteria bacterium]